MELYPQFHSASVKTFLGKTIPAGTGGQESLTQALDHLFNHPNVGPFVGKQLIQRTVTSNPSPAYVARVTAAFNDNGQGVRGDMRAVWRAVLLDPEARDAAKLGDPTFGKLREPMLRLSAWIRAFSVKSTSGNYNVFFTDDPSSGIGQAPFRSPSVFNFYRPGYVPPNTGAATAGLVVPEMQITSETSASSYINFVEGMAILGGCGLPERSDRRLSGGARDCRRRRRVAEPHGRASHVRHDEREHASAGTRSHRVGPADDLRCARQPCAVGAAIHDGVSRLHRSALKDNHDSDFDKTQRFTPQFSRLVSNAWRRLAPARRSH